MSSARCSLDVSPSSNDGAENHHAKRKKDERRDAAAKPQDFTVRNDNNGQVLENGVDRYGKKLQCLGSGVNHSEKKEGDGEP